MKRSVIALLACLALLVAAAPRARAQNQQWQEVLRAAKGQRVYWNAWGGDQLTNSYIGWVARQVEKRFGVELIHVKVNNTAEVVSRVLAEKAAGKTGGGSVDLVWINGENFLAMKNAGLLYGPITPLLPNFRLVDTKGKPATVTDFAVPTDGLESPWTMAQLVFAHDTARTPQPPKSMEALLAWLTANPGRFTHPQVRNFLGSTFLKQALYELAPNPEILQQPATDANFLQTTEELWRWYEEAKPLFWRQGRQFPENGTALRQLFVDSEVDINISFLPSEASSFIANGLYPDTVRTFIMDIGTIGNASFVAIPFNAASKEGALVVANFLLSPLAQAHGQNPEVRGTFSVLDLEKLLPDERKLFENLPKGVATLSNRELGVPLLEPHPSWMTRIVEEWERRYYD